MSRAEQIDKRLLRISQEHLEIAKRAVARGATLKQVQEAHRKINKLRIERDQLMEERKQYPYFL
ncbi:hypothetical protein J2Z48_002181 [Croceifilum oryzae]|uniref:Uncharacterized protein n=1 Tax=Croceifilum oryzae TaxID=1553429 RepID=A0AAJ1TJC5_9BACL|nr:hypothetical protein [Croceifilum oryzae]MDQ0417997.1 hypothetical protein [Croceifilum oryzae]